MRPSNPWLLSIVCVAALAAAGCKTTPSTSPPSDSGGSSTSQGSGDGGAGTSGSIPSSEQPGTASGSAGTSGTPHAGLPGGPVPEGAPGSAGTENGSQAGAGSGVEPQSQSSGVGGSAQPRVAQTSEERVRAIDARLEESLSALDAELKREQERTAQERDARAAAGSASSESESSESEEKEGENDGLAGTAETEAPPSSTEGDKDTRRRPGDLKSDRQRAKTGNTSAGGTEGSGAAAQEIPDGSDDDIVARRLRKAAEQETDPELKEKLWKEYIEYKKNAGK